jgi:L-ascorbate metabolism protein UlaG (beta-lactamase superfamily)
MSLQFRGDARRVEPGDELIDELCIKGISIEVVPSYTHDPSSGHKQTGVGYVVTIAGKRIYYAGVTGLIPEMHDISADISIIQLVPYYDEEQLQKYCISSHVVIRFHMNSVQLC